MSIKVDAAVYTLNVAVDLETLTPDLNLSIELHPECSFLASQHSVLASWLRAAANSLDPEVDQ